MIQFTEFEFADIVNSVAASKSNVASVSIDRFCVEVTFRSNSRKLKWNSYLNFDEQTWHYTYTSPYSGAASPWVFGDEVQRKIKAAIASS